MRSWFFKSICCLGTRTLATLPLLFEKKFSQDKESTLLFVRSIIVVQIFISPLLLNLVFQSVVTTGSRLRAIKASSLAEHAMWNFVQKIFDKQYVVRRIFHSSFDTHNISSWIIQFFDLRHKCHGSEVFVTLSADGSLTYIYTIVCLFICFARYFWVSAIFYS